jgi:hypothetical protein
METKANSQENKKEKLTFKMLYDMVDKEWGKKRRKDTDKFRLIKMVANPDTVGPLELEKLTKIVSKRCGVPIDAIKNKSRIRELILPRQIICFFAQRFIEVGVSYTGTFLHRDHSTIIHSAQAAEDQVDTDKRYRDWVIRIGHEKFGIERFEDMWKVYIDWRNDKTLSDYDPNFNVWRV